MHADIHRLLEAQGGAASVAQLCAAGLSRYAVDALIRSKHLTRVRRDVVVLTEALTAATPWERRRLLIRGIGHSLAPARRPDRSLGITTLDAAPAQQTVPAAPAQQTVPAPAGLALSHGSLLRLQDLPCFGDDNLVHLSRVGSGKGRRDGIVWVHSPVSPDMVVEVEGIRVVVPVLAAMQVAATHGLEAGVVALDGVLHAAEVADARSAHEQGRAPDPFGWRHRDPVSPPGPARAEADRQIQVLLEQGFGKATSTVHKVVALADGRSESSGESRTRWTVHLLGLGQATPQFAVWDGRTLIGVADLKLDGHMVLIEYDGRTKYTGSDDLLSEKWREDRLRELGYQVVRITWEDLARPHVVRGRILAAIARAQASAAPAR